MIFPGDLDGRSVAFPCLFGFGDLAPSPTLSGFLECLSANFSALLFFFCFSGFGETSLFSLSLAEGGGFGVPGGIDGPDCGSTTTGIGGCLLGFSETVGLGS